MLDLPGNEVTARPHHMIENMVHQEFERDVNYAVVRVTIDECLACYGDAVMTESPLPPPKRGPPIERRARIGPTKKPSEIRFQRSTEL